MPFSSSFSFLADWRGRSLEDVQFEQTTESRWTSLRVGRCKKGVILLASCMSPSPSPRDSLRNRFEIRRNLWLLDGIWQGGGYTQELGSSSSSSLSAAASWPVYEYPFVVALVSV